MIKYISNKRHESKKDILGKDLIDRYSKIAIEVDKLNVEEINDDNRNKNLADILNRLVRIHNELSSLTLPATPVSIKYTEFSRGGFLKKNKTINWVIILTILFFILFVILNIFALKNSNYFSLFKWSISISNEICNSLIIVTGSALGAGFYTLITVRKYLINRTYSPRYNPTYIIRYILGITSGTILVMIFENDLSNIKYSTAVLAIVGGFAADAVAIILSGIAETLKRALTNAKENETTEEKEAEKKGRSY